MENNIYEGEFLSLYQLSDMPFTCFKSVWNEKSKKMQVKDFQHEITKWCELVEKYKPYGNVIDTLNFKFIITEKVQSWYDEEITPRKSKAGMRKLGFIAPSSAISKLSIKNLLFKQEEIEFKYFDNEEDVLLWLKEGFE